MMTGPETAAIRDEALKTLTTVDHWRAVASALALRAERIGWDTKVSVTAYNVLEEARKQSKSREAILAAIASVKSTGLVVTFGNEAEAIAFLQDASKHVKGWELKALSWEGRRVNLSTRTTWFGVAGLAESIDRHAGKV